VRQKIVQTLAQRGQNIVVIQHVRSSIMLAQQKSAMQWQSQ
jgi:hypothetical protein